MTNKTYEIANTGSRAIGFRVNGGVESIKPGVTRTLELKEALEKEAIDSFKARGVNIKAAPKAKAEDPANPTPPSDDRPPAETGGVVPQSKVSENGGVDRAPSDTTTTTKPTTKQTGPVA